MLIQYITIIIYIRYQRNPFFRPLMLFFFLLRFIISENSFFIAFLLYSSDQPNFSISHLPKNTSGAFIKDIITPPAASTG